MGAKPCVLVMDGQERAALAVTRSLGQAGIPVVVGAESLRSLAGASKYCNRDWQYPSPLEDPSRFVSSVIDAVSQLGITAIMPVTDSTTQVLAARRGQFPAAVLNAIPPLESYELVSDKYRLMKVAQALGVPIPSTVYVPNGDLASVLVPRRGETGTIACHDRPWLEQDQCTLCVIGRRAGRSVSKGALFEESLAHSAAD